MKLKLLILFIIFKLSAVGQLSDIDYKALGSMKDVTLHVIIKDFCDDTKPYKKLLQKEWKYSKLSFDYSEKYDSDNMFEDGEWYMFIQTYLSTSSLGSSESGTYLVVGRAKGKDQKSARTAVNIPLQWLRRIDKIYIPQSIDLSYNFSNLKIDYLKNTLQIIEQFAEKKVNKSNSYNKTQVNCESYKKVLGETLYFPPHTVKGDDNENFEEFRSSYKVVSDEEISKLFEKGKPFYYVLYASAFNDFGYGYIIEGSTGEIMCVFGGNQKYLNKKIISGLYKELNDSKYGGCK